MASAQVPYDTLQPDQQAIIYFDFGQDRLRPEAEDSLRLLLEGLDRTDDRWIDIEAHTDSIGSAKANRALAMRYEAQSIPLLLIMQGGDVIERVVGAHPYPSLKQAVERHLPAEQQEDDDEDHGTHDADRHVLALQIGVGAFLDRRGDLAHTVVARWLRDNPARLPCTVGDSHDGADERENQSC